MSRDMLRRLNDPTLVALVVAGEDWPRSLLSETLIPDKWMGLIEKADGRRRFVPAGEDPRPQPDDLLLLVRNRPIALTLSVPESPASDGHPVSGACELLVRWHARDDDLAALHRTLMPRRELTLDRLARAFDEAGATAALRNFIRERPAAPAVREDLRDELLAALRDALKRFCFNAGVEIDRVATLSLHSEALERAEALQRETRQRVAHIQARELVEAAALAATKNRLGHLGDVLEKLKAAAAGDPDLRWQELLPALTPAERGRLLENLWRITPNRRCATAVVALVDNDCVWLDPHHPDALARRVSLPPDLGGLRSVSYDAQRGWLLIGAATGVWAVDESTGQVVERFETPDAGRPRTGYNAAVIHDGWLYATHSQLGCWSWPCGAGFQPAGGAGGSPASVGESGVPPVPGGTGASAVNAVASRSRDSDSPPIPAKAILLPGEDGPKTVRSIAVADGRVLFAADDRVHVYDPASLDLSVLGSAGEPVYALAALGGTIYAGTAGGRLLRRDWAGGAWATVHRLIEPIETICVRRWNDLAELVVPAGLQGILGVYGDENVVARLMDSPTPIRRAWACDDLLVGLSAQRDKLVLMSVDAPDRRGRESPLARLTGGSIQDACIVTRCEEAIPRASSGQAPRRSDEGAAA